MACVDGPTLPASGPWDCRHFNAQAYKEELLAERSDQFSSVCAVCFLHASIQGDTGSQQQQLLVAAYSNGLVRVFQLRDAVTGWLTGRKLATPCLCWQAHKGAATSCALLTTASGTAIVTSGADGMVHVWRVQDILHAMSATSAAHHGPTNGPLTGPSSRQPSTRPCGLSSLSPHHTVQLPPAGGNTWGAACQPPSTTTCLVADEQARCVYAGTADGCVHRVDLMERQQGSQVCGSHLAGVWCMDLAPTAGQLATGGEDGLVRLWDVRARTPATILCPSQGSPGGAGTTFAPSSTTAALLPHVRTAAPVTSVRFGGPAGGWLLAGSAGSTPCLTTWSLDAGVVAARVLLPCVPQVLGILPGEVIVAGTGPHLYKYSFAGQLTVTCDLMPQLTSVTALDIMAPAHYDPNTSASAGEGPKHVGAGAVVVGGAGGSLELVSRYGTRLAMTHLQEDLEE